MAKDELVDNYDYDKLDMTCVDRDAGISKTPSFLKMSVLQQHRAVPVTANGMNEYIAEIDQIPEIKCYPNTGSGANGPQGKKGTMDGEQFDSMWEGAVYAYYRYIKGMFIERNHSEWVPYVDENGKRRKFYPDFKMFNKFIEVKGIYRGTDLCKMQQHPEIDFIDKISIQPILEELNKKLPNWKKDYIVTN